MIDNFYVRCVNVGAVRVALAQVIEAALAQITLGFRVYSVRNLNGDLLLDQVIINVTNSGHNDKSIIKEVSHIGSDIIQASESLHS